MEGRITPGEAVDKFEEWLRTSDCPFEIQVHQTDCGESYRVRHYGIWSVSRGWWSTPSRMEVWAVTDKAMAHAQLDVVNQHYSEYEYQVRCIEEWYETMEGPA